MTDTIEYFTLAELPDRPMFRCDKLHGTMQVKTCAERWSLANNEKDDKYGACMNCPIGAKHAGVGEISQSPLRGASVCARCHRSSNRLIKKHLCPSCYNREREYRIGRNARGAKPVKHPGLCTVEIKFLNGDRVQTLSLEVTQPIEVLVTILRDTSLPVVFGFNAKQQQPIFLQRDLFDDT